MSRVPSPPRMEIQSVEQIGTTFGRLESHHIGTNTSTEASGSTLCTEILGRRLHELAVQHSPTQSSAEFIWINTTKAEGPHISPVLVIMCSRSVQFPAAL